MLKKRLFLTLLSTFLIVIISIGISFAWYTNKKVDDFESPDVTGYSTAAYYAGGDGSAEKPFLIKNSRHLYNFAWLQYLGTYNKIENGSVKQYYFEVIDDIDCEGLVLPPIGTTDNPFLGNFNGGNYTIKNVTFTNNFNDLKKKPSSINSTTKFTGCEIIGFFGVFGKYADYLNVNISSQVNSVYDFTIDGVQINNACTNTLAGLIAGFVNGNISNVGVHYGKINLQAATSKISSFKNISSYTLIGDYDEDLVSWEDKPSSENGAGGSLAYGGSFDVDLFFKRLSLIYANKQSSSPSAYLPDMDSETVLAEGNKVPLTVVGSTITEANYTGSKAKEVVSSENIGYATGNQNKARDITMKWGDPLIAPSDMQNGSYTDANGETPEQSGKVPRQMFKIIGQNGNYQASQIRPLTDEEFAALPANIQALIPSSNIEEKRTFLRLQQRWAHGVNFTNTNQNEAWAYLGQVDYYGQKYGEDVEAYEQGGIALPNNGIWFRPKNAGTARIVMYSADNGISFRINKIRRTSATDTNPFEGTSFEVVNDSAVDAVNSAGKNIPAYIVAYYEFEITQDDIDAGNIEYLITKGDENGAYFYYLDIGINGDGDAPSVEPEIKDFAIEGIDFVYLNHSNNTFSSTSDDYSNVFFQISGTTTSIIDLFFRRNNDDDDNYAGSEGIVLFFPKNSLGEEWTTTSSGKTDGDLSLDWSYAGTKGLSGTSTNYLDETECEVLLGNKVSGGLANTNTGANTKRTITYYYRRKKEDGTYESVLITKGTVTNGYAITQPDFEITGYEVVKWYTDEALTQEYDFSKAVTENLVLYASVTETETFTVTFMDGTTELQTLVVNSGSYANPAIPRKEGYVFSHWADASGNKVDLTTTAISADTLLTAVWLDAYDIKFVYNIGGDDVVISTLEVIDDKQTKITKPEDPTLDGYNFAGWYTTKDYTTEFNFDEVPSGDTTIYAKFVAIQYYDVVFGYMDSETLVTIMQVKVEEKTSVEQPEDPTRVGYVFGGWYNDSDCTDGNEFNFSSEITANTTIYAKWQESLVVTFEYEDGTTIDSISVLSGNTITATSIVPSKDGYRFDGNWYVKASDGTVSSTAFDFSTEIEANTILVPGWIKTYEVTIVYDDGTTEETTVDTGTTITLPSSVENEYYITSITSDETSYNEGATVTVTSDMVFNVSKVNIYTVVIDYGNGTTETLYTNINGLVTPTTPNPTNGNLVFGGWMYNGSEFDFSTVITSNMIIEAKWSYVATVTFDANGGTVTPTTLAVDETTGKLSTLPTPTNEDLLFEGWYTDTNYTEQITTDTVIDTSITVYAKWKIAGKVTVVFDANGGTHDASATPTVIIDEGSTVDEIAAPSYGVNEFSHWSLTENGSAFDFSTTITENTTLYAVWTYKATVTFNAGEGTVSASTMTVDSATGKLTSLPTAERTGYAFIEWNTASDGTGSAVTTDMQFTSDTTVYAVWEEGERLNIIFDLNDSNSGGDATFEDGSTSLTVKANADGTVDLPTPIKPNYYFVGWYTESWHANQVDENTVFTNDNTTLYAKWAAAKTIDIVYILADSEANAYNTSYIDSSYTTTTVVPSSGPIINYLNEARVNIDGYSFYDYSGSNGDWISSSNTITENSE